MNEVDKCKVLALCPGTSTTSATALHTIDTLGASRAHIYVMQGTQTTTSQVWADISVFEGTNTSATTLISGASWATEATTSAENILPALATVGETGGVVEISLDLKGRERYINVYTTRGATPTANADGSILVLLEPIVSADNTTTKQMINIQNTTSLSQGYGVVFT